MSASLRFPKYLSDLIIAKGIAHLEPEWNFSISNGKLSLNLTWSNVPTEHLILSPPPMPATRYPLTEFNNNSHRLYSSNTNTPRSDIPPRFLNKNVKKKNEKPYYRSQVSLNISDQSRPTYPEEMRRNNVNENVPVPDISVNISDHSRPTYPEEMRTENVNENVPVPDSVPQLKSDDDDISASPAYSPQSPDIKVKSKEGVISATADTLRDHISDILTHNDNEHSNIVDIHRSDSKTTIDSSSIDDSQSILNDSDSGEIENVFGNDSRLAVSKSEIQEPQDDTFLYQNVISLTSASSPILESPTVSSDVDLASTLSNDTANKLSPLTDNMNNIVLIYSNAKCDREDQIDHISENTPNVDSGSGPPEPPCISDRDQSPEQLSKWVSSMISYLHDHGRFNTVINSTWSRSKKVQNRGLTDDPVSGHPAFRRALDLEGMFHIISQGCPLKQSFLSGQSKSLKDVWSLIYTHYGHRYNPD